MIQDERDRVKLILQHVMACDVGDDLRVKDNDVIQVDQDGNQVRGVKARLCDYPIASWDESSEAWLVRLSPGSKGAIFFDPMHNLDDAWFMATKFPRVNVAFNAATPHSRELHEAWVYTDIDVWENGSLKRPSQFYGVANTLPEALCDATLTYIREKKIGE